jgi:ribosome-associated toxin RatA of RatAB toxin-antitoxin module
MHTVEIIAHVSGGAPDAIFEVLSDFERYPDLTDAVREVRVERETPTRLWSSWEVNFRHGILKWSERDEIDAARRVIAFTQTEGDLAHFTGAWSVDAHPTGCMVHFVAEFDMGMPSLARMLDPIAESALRENIANIVCGLISEPVEILTAPTAVPDGQAA